MANVLVYMELDGDHLLVASLEALGEGRRIASYLGATLYAVLPCEKPPSYGDDDVIAALGRHGADKVALMTAPELGGLALYGTHGVALATACEAIPPTLVLAAATPGGRDVAPRLAARLGAAYVPQPSVEYGSRGELVFSRTVYGGAFRRRLAVDDIERPIVATLTPGSYQLGTGDEEPEVIVLSPPTFAAKVEEVSRSVDTGAGIDLARVVVTAGAGLGPDGYELCGRLAALLGGEAALTRTAVEKGLGSADREVGIGGRTVSPRLYIACGASGSPGHLQAVSPDAEIVAINSDPHAPIFRVATYGIVGDATTVLRALVAELGPDGPSPRADA